MQTERLTSSIAVAVGSVDDQFSEYTCSIRIQKKEKDEILRIMDEMIPELLDEYHKKNRYYPENMVVYRDGVSEGQYQQVLGTEVSSIVAAINKKARGIKLVVITTQKHHNTRFALTQVNQSGRKPTWNVPSGTVVDNAIVEPLYKMFYLNSHFSPLVSPPSVTLFPF